MSPLHQQQPKEVTITWRFWSITTTTTNTMLIIIIIIIMLITQFLLHIHKKDLFLLPIPTEMTFNTTSSPRFYSSAIHLIPIILFFWRLLGMVCCQSQDSCLLTKFSLLSPLPHWFLKDGLPYQNLRAHPCFLLLGNDSSITELEFWLAAHWAPDSSAPNFTESSQFQVNWAICVLPSRESGWRLCGWILPCLPLGHGYVVTVVILLHQDANIKLFITVAI